MRRRSLFWSVPVLMAGAAAGMAQEECIDESGGSIVTAERLARFSPRARAELNTAIIRGWPAAVNAKITSPLRVQHYLTTLATETGGFVRLDENLNYSADRLLAVFPSRVTPAQAQRLHRRPEAIANHVYGGRLGNDQPGDGWLYRGSGYIQLTGKDNFRRRGQALGLDLVGHPEIVRDPAGGFDAAASFWASVDAQTPADADDLRGVRRKINGGLNGIEHAEIWIARAKRIFVQGDDNEEAASIGQAELSALQGGIEASLGRETSPEESFSIKEVIESLLQFRETMGLPGVSVTGLPDAAQIRALYDDDLLYTLTDPFGTE